MLKVAKIGYTMKNGTSRRANVIGLSEQDAVQFLRRLTNNNISSIDDLGMDTDVHGYTDAAIEYLQKKIGKTTSEDKPQEGEQLAEPQKMYICPWCDREFEKSTGLKVHIQRTHQKKEDKKGSAATDESVNSEV
ncbi:MAG: C2H2-type zinc finger protein [Halanaerobiales bacterium]